MRRKLSEGTDEEQACNKNSTSINLCMLTKVFINCNVRHILPERSIPVGDSELQCENDSK